MRKTHEEKLGKTGTKAATVPQVREQRDIGRAAGRKTIQTGAKDDSGTVNPELKKSVELIYAAAVSSRGDPGSGKGDPALKRR